MSLDIKLFSIRQVAQATGKSYRTIYNYILDNKIVYITVDRFKLIPQSEIEKIKDISSLRKQNYTLKGYKTILQAAKILGIGKQTLKKYVKNERIESIKNEAGIYFIPDDIINEWENIALLTDEVSNPDRVEAYNIECVLVRQAAKLLEVSDSTVRGLIGMGSLKINTGTTGKRYVTLSSINKYKHAGELTDIL